MSLTDVIADVERQEKTLRVFNPSDAIVEELAEFFSAQNVAVRREETPSGRPEGFAVLTLDGEFLTAVSTDELRELVETTPSGSDGLGVDDSKHHELLNHLKETTFTSYDRQEMLRVSREIEDRAWRAADGELHAGFQYTSAMKAQRQVYAALADRGVDAFLYGFPDEQSPSIDGVTFYIEEDDAIERTWFVVFDGAGEELDKCALVAEERSRGSYYGFWTYDPAVVDRVLERLEDAYERVRQ